MATSRSGDIKKLSEMLIKRLEKDAAFARQFDRDPAAAVKKLYPQLARVPKEKIDRVFNAHRSGVMAITAARPLALGADPANVAGIVSAAAKLASRAASTEYVRSAARVVAEAAAVEAVTRLLSSEMEPPAPE